MHSKLNIGCGRDSRPGFVNLDSVAGPGVDVAFELGKRPSNEFDHLREQFDYMLMSHVIEHIGNPLQAMETLWQWAKPDCILDVRCPYGSSDDAFEDPTHVRQYFTNSWVYFAQPFYFRADYGYRADWQTESVTLVVLADRFRDRTKNSILGEVHSSRNIVVEMKVRMRAIKPIREPNKDLCVEPEIRFELI